MLNHDDLVEVPLADVPVGTPLFQCGRCNVLRYRNIPICPDCRCPEYGLMVMTPDGPAVDREEDPPYSREARAKRMEARGGKR